MARGDKADLFFRKLRSAGLSKPAVQTLAERLDALEAADSAASSASWPVWLAWTQTPFVCAPGSFNQPTLDHTASDSSWADYIGAENDFALSPTFPANNGTLTFDTAGFVVSGPLTEAIVEVTATLDAVPGDPATGGFALTLTTDFATENIWLPVSGTPAVSAHVLQARRRIVLGDGGVAVACISNASVNITVNRLQLAVAVPPAPNP